MDGRWPYTCYFVECCLQDLFNNARSILVLLPSNFFSICFLSVHIMHPYSSIDTTAAWKKMHFILSIRSDYHMTDSLSLAVPAFASHVLMCFSVDETLLPRLVILSTSFKSQPLSVEMSSLALKHIYSVLCALTWRPMPEAARSRLCSRISAWAAAFARSAMSSASSASVIVFEGYLLLLSVLAWNRFLLFYR